MNTRTARKRSTVGLTVFAIVVGLAFSYRPWIAYAAQRKVTQKDTERMRSAEKSATELAREKAYLEQPMTQERRAREKGFVQPGEKPVGDKP